MTVREREAARRRVERYLRRAGERPDIKAMSDMGYFFGGDPRYQQVFYPNYPATAAAVWQPWEKPRGAQMVFMTLIGGGGGAGGGLTGTDTTNRGGGAGGACGNVTKLIVPALFLPDILYVSVPRGGAGGTGTGVAGAAGISTQVAYLPDPNLAVIVANGGNGGAAGASSGSAVGGTAAALGNAVLSFLATSAVFVLTQGTAGATGGVATGGAGSNASTGISATGLAAGSGGGGVNSADTAGGNQTTLSATFYPSVIGAAAGSNRGTDGYWTFGPKFVGGIGGTGGGGAHNGIGGGGGNGAYGCGGGGGGAGTTGGAGGTGGGGLVIIGCV